jgi:hypothetical protein
MWKKFRNFLGTENGQIMAKPFYFRQNVSKRPNCNPETQIDSQKLYIIYLWSNNLLLEDASCALYVGLGKKALKKLKDLLKIDPLMEAKIRR